MLLRNVGVMYQTARCHNPEHLNDTFTPFCTTTLYTANTVLPEKLTGYQQLKFPHFKEPESPLPYSKESSTCPYPEPDRSNPISHPTSRRFNFNIILPLTPGFFKQTPSLNFLPT